MNSPVTSHRVSILLLLPALLLSLWAGAQPTDGAEGKAIQRRVSWTSVDGQPEGLHIVGIGEKELEECLYFLPDSGTGLIVSSRLDPRTGDLTRRVQDDGSGWWARLSTRFGFEAETLSDFFGRVHSMTDEDTSVVVRFETSQGVVLETAGSVKAYDLVGILFEELKSEHLTAGVAQGIPAAARDAVLFLDVSLGDVHAMHEPGLVSGEQEDPLVELLSRILQEEMGSLRPAPVPMRLEDFRKGLDLSEASQTLLESFATLDTAEPLREF